MDRENKIRDAIGKLVRFRPDRKFMVFFFFLFVSTIFWFLSALGKEYTTSLSYPVRYTNFPDNVVMVSKLPSDLELTVNAHGYTLIKYYISSRLLPIVFDVTSFSLNRLPDTETANFYIHSSLAKTRIAGQLGTDIEILDIMPDTLFFSFTEMVSRTLPVIPVLNLEFERQFMIKGRVGVAPDSVTVSGPETVLDTMQFVPTQPLMVKGINETLQLDVSLPEYDLLDFSAIRVRLTIPVEQFTEASVKVGLETVNLPDTLVMKTFPAGVTVYYLVALSDYDKVSPQQFRAVIDYESLPPGPGRLEVQVVKFPEYVKLLRVAPGAVDYIIER